MKTFQEWLFKKFPPGWGKPQTDLYNKFMATGMGHEEAVAAVSRTFNPPASSPADYNVAWEKGAGGNFTDPARQAALAKFRSIQ